MNHSAKRINSLGKVLGAKSYLEIGVADGSTFKDIEIERRRAVDPQFKFDAAAMANANTQFFTSFSDDYFSEDHDGSSFDAVFIDGLHKFEQVMRDFTNTMIYTHRRSAILLDDTVPNDVFSALPDPVQALRFRHQYGNPGGAWHGDVFKMVFAIHDFWPGLNYMTLVGGGNPQTLVWRSSTFRRKPLFDSLEAISRMNFYDLQNNIEILRKRPEQEALETCLAELR